MKRVIDLVRGGADRRPCWRRVGAVTWDRGRRSGQGSRSQRDGRWTHGALSTPMIVKTPMAAVVSRGHGGVSTSYVIDGAPLIWLVKAAERLLTPHRESRASCIGYGTTEDALASTFSRLREVGREERLRWWFGGQLCQKQMIVQQNQRFLWAELPCQHV